MSAGPATCLICPSVQGDRRISPGPWIHNGRHWVVEHAYPASLLGWVVVVLKRHAEALHELTLEEWREFAEVQHGLLAALRECQPLEKEYVACFAEKEGFHHLHFHVIPKGPGFDPQYSGGKAFHYINPAPGEVLDPAQVDQFCRELGRRMERTLSTEGRG